MKFRNNRNNISGLKFAAFFLIAGFFAGTAGCAEAPKARLAVVDALVDKYIQEEKVAGMVVVVYQDGKPIYERAAGWADKEAAKPMQIDTIFRIASQTKAMTSLAALMLIEEGKLSLDDKLGKYIRPFYWAKVAQRKSKEDPVELKPVHRHITIHHLLTHTSGLSYGTHPDVADFFKAARLGPALGPAWYLSARHETICQVAEKLGRLPLTSQPGAVWVYGYSTDVLGCVIERVSGMKLDEFFRKRIIEKLGMKDTHFYLPADERHRLATLYSSNKDKKAERSTMQGEYVDGPRRNYSGGAGLVSTAPDYIRFLEFIRNGGEIDGVRLVKPETIALMTQNQIGRTYSSTGLGFGYGFEVVESPTPKRPEPAGAFGWSGAYGTYYRVAPKEKLVILVYTQLYPNWTDVKDRLAEAIFQSLTGKHKS